MSDDHPRDPHMQEPIQDPQFEGPAERALAEGPLAPVKTGHPAGLWVLFITEMWERFSYYGMRALLVLYLIASTSEVLEDGTANDNPGFGWSEGDAYLLYGVYTWAVYLTPIFGGWLADKFLGTHRSMVIGGWIIAAGHITLALTELFGYTVGEAVTLQTGPGALLTFMLGLLLIIVGTGFFKPCVSVMVGQLYEPGDPRRDSGFTIFYMGINLGAFFSPLVAGYLAVAYGWHWGFGSAAVGMLAGLFFYQMFRPRYLRGVGLPPGKYEDGEEDKGAELIRICGSCGDVVPDDETTCLACKSQEMTEISRDDLFKRPLRRRDWHRLLVICILAFFGNIFFWAAFEQAGSSLNVFAEESTDRSIPFIMVDAKKKATAESAESLDEGEAASDAPEGSSAEAAPEPGETTGQEAGAAPAEEGATAKVPYEFPAPWYQSVNPLAIIVFAPVFAWLWGFLNKKKLNPSTPLKFALGLYLLGLGFLAMVLGAMQAKGGALAGPHWLLITYVVMTWGELCLSPVGLSMVTKLAPLKLQSFMMGVWFFSFSLANLFAGLLAYISVPIKKGDITFLIEGLPGFFLLLVVGPIGMAVLLTLGTPLLRKLMHGIK